MLICTLPKRLKLASFCLFFPNMLNDKIIALPDLELKYNGVQARGFHATLNPKLWEKSSALNVCSKSCRLKFCLNLWLPNAEPFASSLGGVTLNPPRARAVLSTQCWAERGSSIWNSASQAPGTAGTQQCTEDVVNGEISLPGTSGSVVSSGLCEMHGGC